MGGRSADRAYGGPVLSGRSVPHGSGRGCTRGFFMAAAAVPGPGDELALRLRELMDAAPVVAFVKDPDGRYVYANPYLLAVFG